MPNQLVLVAHGPRAVTRAAIARARRLDVAHLTVVAATPDAGRGLGTWASDRVQVAAATGTPGVAEALESTDGAVVVVHDDVLLTQRALDHLVSHVHATGRLAAPWSNDGGTSSYLRQFPPARRAARDVAAAAPAATVSEPARRLRPACLAGRAADLGRVLHPLFTDPGFLLQDADDPVDLVAGAVVAHDGTCVRQRPRPVGPDGRTLLVASMVVRDEAERLGACLQSLQGLVDRVVVCDTGSTDDTIAVAQAHGAEVIERAWRDDFGWARTEALGPCRDAWYVLHVDADERVVTDDVDALRSMLAAHAAEDVCFQVDVRNVDEDGLPQGEFTAPRVFRPGTMDVRGAIHETPERHDGRPCPWVRLDGLRIDHVGYGRGVVEERDKAGRNLRIAEIEHARAPSTRSALDLARALGAAGVDRPRTEALLAQVIEDPTAASDPLALANVKGQLAQLHLDDGDLEAAVELAAAALVDAPGEDWAAATHARAAGSLGRHDAVLRVAAERRQQPSERAWQRSERHEVTERLWVTIAHLARDDHEAARSALDDVLGRSPLVGEADWDLVVAALEKLDPAGASDRLCELAVDDRHGHVVAAVSRVHGTAVTAQVALAACEQGSAPPAAVTAAATVAVATGDVSLAGRIGPFTDRVDPVVLDRLVERARQRGRDDVADALAAAAFFTP